MPNPVLYAQDNLARTLRGGLRDMGNRRVDDARLGLAGARQKFDMGRQQELDDLNRPAHEWQSMQAQRNIDDSKQPITMASQFPNVHAMEHAMWRKGGEKPLWVQVADMYNADIDTDKSSSTYGWFMNKDTGEPVTMWDADAKADEFDALLLANSGIGRIIRQEKEKNYLALQSGAITDAKYNKNMQNLTALSNDPGKQIEEMERWIQTISRFKGPNFKKGIARLRKSIADKQKLLREDRNTAAKWEREDENKRLDRENRMSIAKLPGKGSDKAHRSAAKRISQINKAKATLDKMSPEQAMMTAFLAANLPDDIKGAIPVGAKIDEGVRQELFQVWDREIALLENEIPADYRRKPKESVNDRDSDFMRKWGMD